MLRERANIDAETVAILFGRGGRHGTQSLLRKNLIPILGRPIMVYPLLAARNSQCVQRLFLSTDDDEIASVGKEYTAEIIERPDYLSTKEALIEDAITHAYGEVVNRIGFEPEYVVILLCNAPNIIAGTIDQGVRILEENSKYDSVITVSRLNMFSPLRARRISTAEGTLKPYVPFEAFGNVGQLTCDRNSSVDAFFADGGMTVVRSKCLYDLRNNLLPFRWMGKEIAFIEQDAGGGDIDSEWQIPLVEYWLAKNGFTKTETPYACKENLEKKRLAL